MLAEILARNSIILAECAIAEQLRRMPEIKLHPTLFNTPLIYAEDRQRDRMTGLYEEYLTVASEAQLPLLLTAPTWRLDSRRVRAAGVPESINSDAVDYLCSVRDDFSTHCSTLVGALVGPKEDCYKPQLSPESDEAEEFHTPQIRELAETKADFLLAQTMCSVRESRGIARAMSRSQKPYILSFCARPDGSLLDGTRLDVAMRELDNDPQLRKPPVGYSVNCTHPSFFLGTYPVGSLQRLIGIQANGSSKDVTNLDGADQTEADPVDDWVGSMQLLHKTHQVSILGGCCGTSATHMKGLARHMLDSRTN